MAAGDAYVTVDDLSAYIGSANNLTGIDISNNSGELTAACEAASRAVDHYCGRVFWDAGAVSAREFQADDPYLLDVPDFHTTTGLVVKTDETDDGTFDTTWASTDYQVGPADGVRDGTTGWPFWLIEAVESRWFPTRGRRRRVEITAQWGWAAVPDPVKQATLLLAHRLFDRSNSPEGVAGFGEFGAVRVTQRDPDVIALLAGFRRQAMLVT